jgi:di/tricarboxylate transporter
MHRGKKMKAREFVVWIYVIAFFLSVGGIGSVYFDRSLWKYISLWQQTLFAFYLLVGFCGVLLAYWVHEDEEQIDWLAERLRGLERSVRAEIDEVRQKTKK